jgi:mRNA interferase MazF
LVTINAGDIYWVDLGMPSTHEQAKRRPCVVMSRAEVNATGGTVVVVPLSSTLFKANAYRIKVPLAMIQVNPGQSLHDSVALCDHVREVDKQRLETYAGKLTRTAVTGVSLGLAYIFNI